MPDHFKRLVGEQFEDASERSVNGCRESLRWKLHIRALVSQPDNQTKSTHNLQHAMNHEVVQALRSPASLHVQSLRTPTERRSISELHFNEIKFGSA